MSQEGRSMTEESLKKKFGELSMELDSAYNHGLMSKEMYKRCIYDLDGIYRRIFRK
jgi:uncharacterized protein YqgQ